MSRLSRGLLVLALTLLLLPLLLLALALQREPAVDGGGAIALADVERALRLAQWHDPRRALPGIVRTLHLSQHEAELLLNHLSARWLDTRTRVEIGPGRLRLQASVALPAAAANPFGRWLNTELVLLHRPGLPALESARIGRLPLPAPAVQWVAGVVAARQGIGEAGSAAVLALQRVRFAPGRLTVGYAWGTRAPARALAAVMPASEHARMQRYAERLAELAAARPPEQAVSLSELLPPMFELARQRSGGSADAAAAAAENRAALLTLGMVAVGIDLATLLPDRGADRSAGARVRPLRLTLAGRRDFPQHFLVSATLAAERGTPLADLIGLYKEMADARGGSGFSFNDLAANRAGTRFGVLAVQDPAWLQQRLAGGVAEQDFMPDVADLPEGLPDRDFRRRYGGPGSPAYDKVLAEIEGRLDAAALFSPASPASSPLPR